MDFKVEKTQLSYNGLSSNALILLPNNPSSQLSAAFTHGFTSSKFSILTWGQKLAENGIQTVLFDLPGHYLGSFNEVDTLDNFTSSTPGLFELAFNELKERSGVESEKFILGGHSLGALMSLKALEEDFFENKETYNVCVGFGFGPKNSTHAFDMPLFKKTMDFRNQLVSPVLNSNDLLPWIKGQKANLQTKDRRIHLLTGEDDVIVSKNGSEELRDILLANGNDVTLDRPKRLSHHQPDLAGPHIWSFVRSILKEG